MTITAEIIADSQSAYAAPSEGGRLTTFKLRYPRFIHAELMTHRVFSRNASSSRAIPVKRLIEDIRRDPAMPIHWGRNQPGMQAREEHDAPVELHAMEERGDFDGLILYHEVAQSYTAVETWLEAMEFAILHAEAFDKAGYHKQIVNRLLEPFSHINVVLTASMLDNFFHLRRHPDAQPEIKVLADAMWEAMQASRPDELFVDDWHLPFVTQGDTVEMVDGGNGNVLEIERDLMHLQRISVARCARVSYETHDGRVPTADEDLKLYDRLVGSAPLHASPAEHQATPLHPSDHFARRQGFGGNLGPEWVQFRKTLPHENVTTYTP